MLGLLGADDIEQASRTDPLDTVEHAGQVARGVREGPGATADDQRQRLTLAVAEARREHDQRAVRFLQQTERIEAFQHIGHQRLVPTLPRQVGVSEEHSELLVDLVPVLGALGHERVPQLHRLLVAPLQPHNPSPGALLKRLVLLELARRLLVEGVEIAELHRAGSLGADVSEVLDEHPERSSPVANVVLPHDLVTDGTEQPHHSVPDDRRAQMPDVHLLGHVGSRVVDDDPFWARRLSDPEERVGGDLGHERADELGPQRQVDEPRPGQFGIGHAVEACGGDDLCGDVTRVAAQLLRERQRTVCLAVRPVRGTDHRIDVGATGDAFERWSQAIGDGFERVSHGGSHDAAPSTQLVSRLSSGRRISLLDGGRPSW